MTGAATYLTRTRTEVRLLDAFHAEPGCNESVRDGSNDNRR